jgi:hypothetical protein
VVHAVVSAVFGGLLLAGPGRFLGWFGWAPIDPIISRLLGAALLALAWGSYRGWRAVERAQVAILIELEAVFCVLASLGLLAASAGGCVAVVRLAAVCRVRRLGHRLDLLAG